MQLDERLREHVDGLAEPVSLDAVIGGVSLDAVIGGVDLVPPKGAAVAPLAPPTNTVLRAAAAAILIIFVLGTILIVRRGASSTVFADQTSSTLPSLPDFPEAASGWQKIDNPFAPRTPGSAVAVQAALAFNNAGWAVGSEWMFVPGNGKVDARKRGMIWRSDDGKTWEAIDADFGSFDTPAGNWVPSGIALEHIVASGNTLLAFGNEYRNGSVPVGYRSTDGSNWQPIDVPFAADEQAQLVSVDVSGNRIAAVVIIDGLTLRQRTQLLISDDRGGSWRVVPVDVEFNASIHALSLLGDRVVLVGATNALVGTGQSAKAAVWYSDDLTTWARATTPTSSSTLSTVENGPTGLLSTGKYRSSIIDETQPADDSSAVVWRSEDGSNWSALDFDLHADARQAEPRVVAHENGMLVLTPFDGGVEAITSTRSRTVSLGQLPATRAITLLAINDRLVLVGATGSVATADAEETLSVWLGPNVAD